MSANEQTTADASSSMLDELHPRRFFLDVWRKVDEARAGSDADVATRDARFALATAVVCLIGNHYAGRESVLDRLLTAFDGSTPVGERLRDRITDAGYWDLTVRGFWCAVLVTGYFVVPALALKLRGKSLKEHHLGTQGLGEHAWIYGLAYGVVLLCIVGASLTPEFRTYYPIYELAHRSVADLLAWWFVYAVQLFSVEFFFRGYLLRALRGSLGSAAIFVSMIPYVMVHFGKPLAETFGAIFAGVVLGTLAMRTRSVWLGVALHVSIAWTMDLMALHQKAQIPSSLFATN